MGAGSLLRFYHDESRRIYGKCDLMVNDVTTHLKIIQALMWILSRFMPGSGGLNTYRKFIMEATYINVRKT